MKFQRTITLAVTASDMEEADDAFIAIFADLQSNLDYGLESIPTNVEVDSSGAELSPDTVQVE